MKFKTIGVVIRYTSTSQYGWAKSEPQTPMTPAGRNVAATASRIARKAYRLHYLRQGADLVGIDLTKSENVTFTGIDSPGSHFHNYTVGKHTVRIFDVSDNHPGNYCSVTISDGRTEQGSSVTLKPVPGH
jgi:hypothetical protein